MYASIDTVHDKLERQIRDDKGHTISRKRGGTSAGEYAAEIDKVTPSSSSRTRS
jgi:putative sigma-54 modulation protein